KLSLQVGDSLRFDFDQLAPLDFAYIDGAHDLEHVLSDTQKVYAALREGGVIIWHDFDSPTPWVHVRQALAQANLPETILHVAGSQVAFLFKQPQPAALPEKESRGPGEEEAVQPTGPVALAWEGSFSGLHSLALVNRELCSRLLQRGHDLG